MDFSIIIPAKNEEHNIGRCLDSIARMESAGICYEVIVIDNGSTDRTAAIAREKGATVYVLPGLTISSMRNFGAFHSIGRIIAFLDADCAVTGEWLSAASRYLADSAVAAFGSPAVVPGGATWVQRAWFNVRGKPGQVVEVEWLESANLLVSREAFSAVGGFDEALATCEDYDLTSRLKTLGKLVSDYRVGAIHYREPATIAQFMKKEMWRSKSNYKGIMRRRIAWREIPSLVLPVMYLSMFVAGVLLVAMLVAGLKSSFLVAGYLLILAALQVAVVIVSLRKNNDKSLGTACQLFVLINLYFVSRGFAVISRN